MGIGGFLIFPQCRTGRCNGISMSTESEKDTTSKIRSRYDRVAPVYDLMEAVVERSAFREWRRNLIGRIKGEEVLEVGVGTGKNLPFYPPEVNITGIDISTRMLDKAVPRSEKAEASVNLFEMDAENLDFPDNHFDTSLATFVFCSVPDPVEGLREMGRVTKSEGKILLLEHMRPDNDILGPVFDLFNPLTEKLLGPNINRETMQNIQKAGLKTDLGRDLTRYGIVKLIEARP